MRARGKEAGDKLQHLTQVNPRKAGLIEASVPTNATPDIQPLSEQYWGRRRQDIDHSYFKRLRKSALAVGSEKETTTT